MKKVEYSLPNHYATIDDLTLYRWDRYTATKDNNWFLVDYDGRQKKDDSEELKEVEKQIQDQYFKAVNDRAFSVKMQKWGKIDYLMTKYRVLDLLINSMFDGVKNNTMDAETRIQYIFQLGKWGFKIPLINNVIDDLILLNQFRTSLEGISTQIAILNSELKDDGKKESQSLLKQLRIVEIGLGYSYRLDAKKITVSEWIEELKLLEEKAKNN